MSPAVGVSNVAISLARVVFPQPLSPTSASTSPSWILMFTSSTAFTKGGRLLVSLSRTPDLPVLKCFLRPRVSTSGSAVQEAPH